MLGLLDGAPRLKDATAGTRSGATVRECCQDQTILRKGVFLGELETIMK